MFPFHFCFHQNTNPQLNFQYQKSSNSLVSQVFHATVSSLMNICSRLGVTQLSLLVLLCLLLCCPCFLPCCSLVLLLFLLCCLLSCFLGCFLSFGLGLCLSNRTIFCYNASCCRSLVIGSQVVHFQIMALSSDTYQHPMYLLASNRWSMRYTGPFFHSLRGRRSRC